jgi:hypothetical protein
MLNGDSGDLTDEAMIEVALESRDRRSAVPISGEVPRKPAKSD